MRRMITGKQAEQIETNKEAIEELQNNALKLYKHTLTFEGTETATISNPVTIWIVNADKNNYSYALTETDCQLLEEDEQVEVLNFNKLILPYIVLDEELAEPKTACDTISIYWAQDDLGGYQLNLNDISGVVFDYVLCGGLMLASELVGLKLVDTVTAL